MNNSLIKDILDELMDTDKSLLGPMMKLYYFAKEIQNEALTTFLNKEINGYEVEDDIPDYRKTGGQLFVTVQVGMYANNTNECEIPRSFFSDKMQSLLTEIQLYEGVAVLEKMVEENKQQSFIYKGLPMEALHIISPVVKKLYSSTRKLTPIAARVKANANIISQATQSIRTRLLDFVYEIKEAFGLDINISEYKKDHVNNNQTINNFMSTTIHNTGNGNFINTGNNNHNVVNITIQKGDLAAFQKRLEEIGVESEEIKEISEIVQTEQLDGANLGPKASGWIGKMVTKTLSGASKIGIGAAGNLLATAVKLYLGIPG